MDCRFLPTCSSVPCSVRQGSKEGWSLYSSGMGGVRISLLLESHCYLTASPPIPLPSYGASAVNVYFRSVPNCPPPSFWQALHLMGISVVFTALFAPARPTFTPPHVHTVHPNTKGKPITCPVPPPACVSCCPADSSLSSCAHPSSHFRVTEEVRSCHEAWRPKYQGLFRWHVGLYGPGYI